MISMTGVSSYIYSKENLNNLKLFGNYLVCLVIIITNIVYTGLCNIHIEYAT